LFVRFRSFVRSFVRRSFVARSFVRKGRGRRRRNDEGKMTREKKSDDEGKKRRRNKLVGKSGTYRFFQTPPRPGNEKWLTIHTRLNPLN
jgi:hypothetical protein